MKWLHTVGIIALCVSFAGASKYHDFNKFVGKLFCFAFLCSIEVAVLICYGDIQQLYKGLCCDITAYYPYFNTFLR